MPYKHSASYPLHHGFEVRRRTNQIVRCGSNPTAYILREFWILSPIWRSNFTQLAWAYSDTTTDLKARRPPSVTEPVITWCLKNSVNLERRSKSGLLGPASGASHDGTKIGSSNSRQQNSTFCTGTWETHERPMPLGYVYIIITKSICCDDERRAPPSTDWYMWLSSHAHFCCRASLFQECQQPILNSSPSVLNSQPSKSVAIFSHVVPIQLLEVNPLKFSIPVTSYRKLSKLFSS